MCRLFLCSYFAGVTQLFQKFMYDNSINDKKILFISTAANVESYRGYIDEAIIALHELGYQPEILDIAAAQVHQIQQKIENAKILYISGGNTFYLLQELKRNHLIPILINKIKHGLPYIGESAGAMIMAENIGYNHIMDDASLAPDLTDYTAIGITDFYTLPHYMEEPFTQSVQETERVYHYLNFFRIRNDEAIVVNGDTHQIIKQC